MSALLPNSAGTQPASKAAQNSNPLAVVVPTRSRPRELRRCLVALAVARRQLRFPVYVCDSSPSEPERAAIREVCEPYEWVHLSTHSGSNAAAARNACARVATGELLVNVDDDLELEPDAIDRLLSCYQGASGLRVVGGSVSWDGGWSAAMKLRPIGYARPAHESERADFIPGALFLYPRSFALAWPWNERIDTSDDIFMGALWRSHGVRILFAEDARALHIGLPISVDPSRIADTVRHQRWHIYALLFDSVFANPSLWRTLSYETLGFLASAKRFLRQPRWAISFLCSWIAGHVRLIGDRHYLRALVRTSPFR